MITAADEACLDPRCSCTDDEAVAKLLGWMRSRWRIPNLLVTADGIDMAQLPHILALPGPLDQFITCEREFASVRVHNAVCNGDTLTLQKWEELEAVWKQIGENAVRYRFVIQEELSRPNSKLHIDYPLTEQTGVRHITLASLDRWARIKFGFPILDEDEASRPGTPPRIGMRQQEAAILEHICQLGHDPLSLPKWKPTSPGVKAAVLRALNIPSQLFPSLKSFEKAWGRLREDKHIIDQGVPQNNCRGETCRGR